MEDEKCTVSRAIQYVQEVIDASGHFNSSVEDDEGSKVIRIKLKNGQAVGSVTIAPNHVEGASLENAEAYLKAATLSALNYAARSPLTKDYVAKLQHGA